jgi:hypothetical protein
VRRTYPHDEYLRKYHYGWFDGIWLNDEESTL